MFPLAAAARRSIDEDRRQADDARGRNCAARSRARDCGNHATARDARQRYAPADNEAQARSLDIGRNDLGFKLSPMGRLLNHIVDDLLRRAGDDPVVCSQDLGRRERTREEGGKTLGARLRIRRDNFAPDRSVQRFPISVMGRFAGVVIGRGEGQEGSSKSFQPCFLA